MHLRSDVPVGTCLSGGLDSSTIVALATERAQRRAHEQLFGRLSGHGLRRNPLRRSGLGAFQHHQARRHAAARSRLHGSAEQDGLASGCRRSWQRAVVSRTPSCAWQQGNVTVLLDGQGSDELMAGYLSHAVYYYRTLLRQQPAALGGRISRPSRSKPGSAICPASPSANLWRVPAICFCTGATRSSFLAAEPGSAGAPARSAARTRQSSRRRSAQQSALQSRHLPSASRRCCTTKIAAA